MLTDNHVHTRFSEDSKADPEQIVAHAREQGIGLMFTDHCECGQISPPNVPAWPPFDAENCLHALSAYRGEHVGVGVELGQAFMNMELAERTVRMPWDVILGSLHNMRDTLDFYYISYEQYTDVALEQLMTRYFAELYELVQWGKFDVLAHLTYPLRYLYRAGRTLSLSSFDEQIRMIFRLLIEQGKALEVNTSGLSDAAAMTFPSLREIRIFRELGGELVTLGSDAHRPEHVGRSIRDGAELLRTAGFRFYAAYRERKPHLCPL